MYLRVDKVFDVGTAGSISNVFVIQADFDILLGNIVCQDIAVRQSLKGGIRKEIGSCLWIQDLLCDVNVQDFLCSCCFKK